MLLIKGSNSIAIISMKQIQHEEPSQNLLKDGNTITVSTSHGLTAVFCLLTSEITACAGTPSAPSCHS